MCDEVEGAMVGGGGWRGGVRRGVQVYERKCGDGVGSEEGVGEREVCWCGCGCGAKLWG